MSGRFLLDTNIVIALFAGDPSVEEQLEQAEEVFVPRIVLGELYFGASKSGRAQQNLRRIDEFGFNTAVIASDIDTAREYGVIKSALQEKGQPIPENGIWIAAIARQHDLTLVTRDGHFKEVEHQKIEMW
ncbi:tRNA(fMet)-specific endonuclease VapC [Methanophagales archaeon]|nr:tRNA(fMet)-specific endonuclease VapC [Methanophagales archaeon]